jgi:hypothetical protein
MPWIEISQFARGVLGHHYRLGAPSLANKDAWEQLGECLFANKMKVNIRPGKSVKMFTGKYNKSFVLSFFDPTASSIGPLLGSSYVDWTYDVRYLQFSDGKSVGKRINN